MKRTYDIDGMTCASCQATIEKALDKQPGIASVNVSLIHHAMDVDYDPSVISPEEITSIVDRTGYAAHPRKDTQSKEDTHPTDKNLDIASDYGRRLILSVLFFVPLFYLGMGGMLGFPIPTYLASERGLLIKVFMEMVLASSIAVVNRGYFKSGLRKLIHRKPNMDSLIAVGSGAALLYGLYVFTLMLYHAGQADLAAIISYRDDIYLDGAGAILTFVTMGKYIEFRSKAKTNDAIRSLMQLKPEHTLVQKDGTFVKTKTAAIVKGDLIKIKPGMRIPVDGTVTEGRSDIDESMLTGESLPVFKTPGDSVYAGTINTSGTFVFEATNIGSETTLERIITLVGKAQSSKAPIQRLADTISLYFVPAVLGIAFVSFAVWLMAGASLSLALSMGITVLVISCPCALGLATPVAVMVGTGMGAKHGILIKTAESLEVIHAIDTIVLDKTNTITTGSFSVRETEAFGMPETMFMQVVKALESASEHPIAEAIHDHFNDADDVTVRGFKAWGGLGVTGEIDGVTYYLGNHKLMERYDVADDGTRTLDGRLSDAGMTNVYLSDGRQVLGYVALHDTIRDHAASTVRWLKHQGFQIILLTGDNSRTGEAVRRAIGADRVIADVMPEEKEQVIASLQGDGRKVAMVGDGINDAIALTRADLGVAIGAGTDVAIDSADVVLLNSDPADIARTVMLGERTMKTIRSNLFFAFLYNAIGIPVAAGLLYPSLGIRLSPAIGALAMSLSSVSVVLNALRLYRVKLSAVPPVNRDSGKRYVVHVRGMTCDQCKMRVEEALRSIGGVRDVSADPKHDRASFVADASPDEATIKQTIKQAGYDVTKVVKP